MSKFKVGDTVKRIKDCYFGMEIGDIGIIESVDGIWVKVKGNSNSLHEDAFKLIKPEFKNGDEVEVSDNGINWHKATYVGTNPKNEGMPYIVSRADQFFPYIYCRHPRKEYTLKECADALGVPVDEFRIKDE